jgi:hypothetical protein
MSSIALIVRADRELESLPFDWIPQSLGSREVVLSAIEKCVPKGGAQLALILTVEDDEGFPEPRTIAATGVWGSNERIVIKELCDLLDARFYDAESGDFIDL